MGPPAPGWLPGSTPRSPGGNLQAQTCQQVKMQAAGQAWKRQEGKGVPAYCKVRETKVTWPSHCQLPWPRSGPDPTLSAVPWFPLSRAWSYTKARPALEAATTTAAPTMPIALALAGQLQADRSCLSCLGKL